MAKQADTVTAANTSTTRPDRHPTEHGGTVEVQQVPNVPPIRTVPPRRERFEGIIQTVIMLAIGGAAGAASFRHVHDVAAAHGQPGWLAWTDAVTLELASIAAGLDLRRRKRIGKSVGFPAAVLTVAVILSLSAQVVEAEPSIIGWLAAALPALGFLAMVKMALGRADSDPTNTASDQRPARGRPGLDPDERSFVADTTGPVQDRSRTGGDVTRLVPAARKAAASLTGQGIAVNRATLAAQLRNEGHALSTATATALVRLLRNEPSATFASGQYTQASPANKNANHGAA